jgi:hypothetical protein
MVQGTCPAGYEPVANLDLTVECQPCQLRAFKVRKTEREKKRERERAHGN